MPYDYGALEPAMSGEILELHHSKHHAAYVKGSNDALEQLAEARDKGDFAALVELEKTFAFNLSGHVLHSIFWNNLSPHGGDRPDGELAAAIDEHFGSFDGFAGQLSAATKSVQGSGWGVLAWEHAYYLQYRNVRPDYVDRLWNLVDWADVTSRFEAARAAAPKL